ncbi:MAG TPA: hypothetical protein VMW93_07815 [bacterium]|nr:hypothetical protein [bacterium]
MRSSKWRAVWAGTAAAVLFAAHAGAFGKSAVRNEKMAWRVLPTDHFDIYYYE